MNLIIKKKKGANDLVNLIPMINLVFLLLIFFLLTGVVSQQDPIEISKPNSIFGKENSIKKNEKNIYVSEEGEIFIDTEKINIEALNEFVSKKDKVVLVLDKNIKIILFNEIIKILNFKDLDKVFIKVKKER